MTTPDEAVDNQPDRADEPDAPPDAPGAPAAPPHARPDADGDATTGRSISQ